MTRFAWVSWHRCHHGRRAAHLRKTPRLQDAAAWFRALTDGELQSRGMPQFREHVTEKHAELIRGYVARQASFLYAEEQAATSSSEAIPH